MTAQFLPAELRRARRLRRLSQLELALRLEVSQRHVSFVENGRTRPSRQLLHAWLAALDVPLATRNQVLQHAGFAQAFSDLPLSDQSLQPALRALRQLLDSQRQTPVLVLDSRWNVLMLNQAMQQVALLLMPTLAAWLAANLPTPSEPLSMLELIEHPQGLFSKLLNPHEVFPSVVAHLQEIALQHPELETRLTLLARRLQRGDGIAPLQTPPVLTSRFSTEIGELAFFSMFSTFGTPQHITLSSLRVEHLFAADANTEVRLQLYFGGN